MQNYTECTSCRYCHSAELVTVLDLGKIYPSDFIEDTPKMGKVPLVLVRCEDCGLVQLKHTVERDELYRQYWYRSSLNNSMIRDLQDIVDQVETYVGDGDTVVDIGCNDGTMLSLYKKNVYKIGYDPSENVGNALGMCDAFINDYFTAEAYKFQKAKAVTAIAMFYDLPDILPFVKDVESILKSDGVFILQLTDLKTTIEINAIDNIVHEHLEYYTLSNLEDIMESANMEIIDVSYNQVNGGSIRVVCAKWGVYAREPSVIEARINEAEFFKVEGLDTLVARIEDYKEVILNFLSSNSEFGNTVAVMSASTKGNTLLQLFGIDSSLIAHAAEINPEKFGLKTVGSNITIIPEKWSLALKPDFYLILAWHFVDNFIEKQMDYLKAGGAFIVPLPKPAVYYYLDGEVLKHELQ